MPQCLYNAIKTPDGTILWCQDGHDYQTHKDNVSNEEYMNDGLGYGIRRSVNKVPFEDLSVWSDEPFEKVRTAKLWGSYGKDGKSERVILAPAEMEKDHIEAILATQKRIYGTFLEDIFLNELKYRVENLKKKLEDELPNQKKVEKNKPKV